MAVRQLAGAASSRQGRRTQENSRHQAEQSQRSDTSGGCGRPSVSLSAEETVHLGRCGDCTPGGPWGFKSAGAARRHALSREGESLWYMRTGAHWSVSNRSLWLGRGDRGSTRDGYVGKLPWVMQSDHSRSWAIVTDAIIVVRTPWAVSDLCCPRRMIHIVPVFLFPVLSWAWPTKGCVA